MVTNWKNTQTNETCTLTKLGSGIIFATFWLNNRPIASATFFSATEAKSTLKKSYGWKEVNMA